MTTGDFLRAEMGWHMQWAGVPAGGSMRS